MGEIIKTLRDGKKGIQSRFTRKYCVKESIELQGITMAKDREQFPAMQLTNIVVNIVEVSPAHYLLR